jgi:Holin of 3TMs, for gene-transfer release
VNPITAIFSTGFKGVLDGVSGILDHFIADPEEKLKAQLQLTQMGNDLQLAVLNTDRDVAVQQASVVIAEAKSDSWLAANWRPITMLTFVFIIVWNFMVVPLLSAAFASVKIVDIPPDMWHLLSAGLQGYIYSRSAEKIAPGLIAAIKK